MTVDIVKYEDEILVYKHYEGDLIFECDEKQKEYRFLFHLMEKTD